MKLIPAALRTALASGALMLVIGTTLFSSSSNQLKDSCVYFVDGTVPAKNLTAMAYQGPLLPGVQVYCDGEPGGSIHVLADLVVEESFIEQANSDWENQARRILQDVNDILVPIHVKIDVATLQTWATDRPSSHISQRLVAAEEQTNREPGNMLIAITADSSSRDDGLARRLGGSLIIRHYPEHLERGPMLIVHEFGHLLGARHHGADEECSGEECIMDESGYIQTDEWCHHHLDVIEENIKSRLGHSIS